LELKRPLHLVEVLVLLPLRDPSWELLPARAVAALDPVAEAMPPVIVPVEDADDEHCPATTWPPIEPLPGPPE
jgi:hypothetical protein